VGADLAQQGLLVLQGQVATLVIAALLAYRGIQELREMMVYQEQVGIQERREMMVYQEPVGIQGQLVLQEKQDR
jgi:hypothetical protein